jgi:hypothetical protein
LSLPLYFSRKQSLAARRRAKAFGSSWLEPVQIETGGQLPVGTILNDLYQIDGFLAQGGMGELYRGHTLETGDAVAIKLIRPELAKNEAYLTLFRKEASALSRINHQTIVRYYVFSLEPKLKRHFMAMELVQGESLSELLNKGPMKSADVRSLSMRLASGLQAAHDQGIVHRDVSPDNIIIQDGNLSHARIIDFGIARSTRPTHTTIVGDGFAGKHNYVSPEQVGLFGGDITEKSDIYSLGLVLVQCLRGRPIDMGGTWFEMVEKRTRLPDVSDVDRAFRLLLKQMLQPDPAKRLARMEEVLNWPGTSRNANVGALADHLAASVAGGSFPLRWALGSILLATLLAASALFLWIQYWPLLSPGPQRQADAEKERILQFVRNYNGGSCFLATPTKVTSSEAEINGYGNNVAPFDALDKAFKTTFNLEPKIYFRKIISANQCATLAFVGRLSLNSDLELKFEINKSNLVNGEILEGSLLTRAPYVALLIVDDQGAAHGLSDRLKQGPNGQKFLIGPLEDSDPRQSKQYLLVGVASSAPINALKIIGPQPSNEILSSALAQARLLDRPASAAIAVIRMN